MSATRVQLPLAALLAGALACAEPGGGRPNVLLLVVDTLRADHVLDPEELVDTPSLDHLAVEGVSFPHAFSHAPMTLPAHTSLFSSRLPDETGVVLNMQTVPREVPLLAELLASEGWATSAVVSIWTLGNRDSEFGIERGFERYDRGYLGLLPPAPMTQERLIPELRRLAEDDRPFFLFAHYSDPHIPYNVHDGSVDRRARLSVGGELVEDFALSKMVLWEGELALPPGESEVELVSEHPFRYDFDLDYDEAALELLPPEAGDFVPGGRSKESFRRIVTRWRNRTDAPTTLEVALWLGEEPSNEEKRARYPGEVEFVDGYVGELLDELRTLGLYDDTLIVFTSDHGEALGEHDHWGHNQNLFDELLHVPLVVKLPAGHPGEEALAASRHRLVSHVDLAPTILDALDLPTLPGQRGRSLLGSIADPPALFAATHLPLAKAADGSGERGEDVVSLRDAHFKLIYTRSEDRYRMIDLAADPDELGDVFAERGHERAGWQPRLRQAAERLDAIDFEAVLSGASEEEKRSLSALGYGTDE